ncbi:MAG TPA: hypothetical protein VIP77_01425 [Jiangellaceae bacterium]
MSAGGVLAVAELCREQTPRIQETAFQLSELQLDFSAGIRDLRRIGTDEMAARLEVQRKAIGAALLALSLVNSGFQAVGHAAEGITQSDTVQSALATLAENDVDLGTILREVDKAHTTLTEAQGPIQAVLQHAGGQGEFSGRRLIEALKVVAPKVPRLHDDLQRILVANRLTLRAVEDVGDESP